jgi:hypothetical protein
MSHRNKEAIDTLEAATLIDVSIFRGNKKMLRIKSANGRPLFPGLRSDNDLEDDARRKHWVLLEGKSGPSRTKTINMCPAKVWNL